MSMYRVRTTFTGLAGAPYLSTHYFNAAIPPTQAEANAAVAAVGAFWTTIDVQLLNTLSWGTETTVDVVDPANGQTVSSYSVTPATGTGNVAGSPLPFATQGLIRWTTGSYIGGRQVRGRTFVPGIPSSALSGGGPSAAVVSAMNTAAAAMIADGATVLTIWSRVNNTVATVGAGSAWTNFAVLRSRRD